MTNVSIAIPDDVMHQLESQWTDIAQRTLEALAIESYRRGILTSAEVQRMLNMRSRWEVETLLKRSRAYLDYTEADLEQDIQTLESLWVA
jgi:predicted HTH domain antitoxin